MLTRLIWVLGCFLHGRFTRFNVTTYLTHEHSRISIRRNEWVAITCVRKPNVGQHFVQTQQSQYILLLYNSHTRVPAYTTFNVVFRGTPQYPVVVGVPHIIQYIMGTLAGQDFPITASTATPRTCLSAINVRAK